MNATESMKRDMWEALAFTEVESAALAKAAAKCGERGKWKAREFVIMFLWRRHGWDGLRPLAPEDRSAAKNGVLMEAARIEEESAVTKARNVRARIAGVLLGLVLEDEDLRRLAVIVFARCGAGALELCQLAVFAMDGMRGGIEAKHQLLARWLAVPDYVLKDAGEVFERVAKNALKHGRGRRRRRKIQPWLLG